MKIFISNKAASFLRVTTISSVATAAVTNADTARMTVGLGAPNKKLQCILKIVQEILSVSESNEGFEISDLSYKVDSTRRREPIQGYAHKQHVVAELRSHVANLDKSYPNPLWDFVEGPLFTSNAYGVIYDAPDGQRLFHYPALTAEQAQDQSPQKPVLRIANPIDFLDALQTLHASVYSSGSDRQFSLTRGGLMRINPAELIWNNATEADFYDPVQFLQRKTNFLQDENFTALANDWHPRGQILV